MSSASLSGKTSLVPGSTSGMDLGIAEITDLVLLLCSDAAASITGAVIPVDGGWPAQ